jgi:hypothetical protein
MNRLGSPRITWVEGFGSSRWNFVVSLAEVMGLVAGCAELRGEVAYLLQAPPRRQISTKFLRMVKPDYDPVSGRRPRIGEMSHDPRQSLQDWDRPHDLQDSGT